MAHSLPETFAPLLLRWYAAGHRDLPWRQDREPYHIWLSEIMLQQTRVEAVRGYYARFLAELPPISPRSPRAKSGGSQSSGRGSATTPACATCRRRRR